MTEDQRLKLILAEGEGQKIEFKEALSPRLQIDLVAFANASGGSLFLGVDDKGDIAPISFSNRVLSQIQDLARNCDPALSIRCVKHRAGVLEIQVPEGPDKPYRCQEGFFLRIGPNSQKLRRDEIVQIALQTGKQRFDEQWNEHFEFPRDFSGERLDRFVQLIERPIKARPSDVLISLGLAEEKKKKLTVTNCAALFFAKEPQKFFPESYITCVRYRGLDRFSIIDKQDFYGSPIDVIDQTLHFLQRHISGEKIVEGFAQHREVFEYPLVAIREAVVNAVAHRDYFYDGSHIYVHLFSDRLEIENPGGLFRGMTLEELGTRSVRRNRLIADILHRARLIERVGSGFDRIKRALEENQNPLFEISNTNFFTIRFFPRIPGLMHQQMTPRQVHLIRFLTERKAASKSECASFLGVSEDTSLRELNALFKKKMIMKTGSGKSTRYKIK